MCEKVTFQHIMETAAKYILQKQLQSLFLTVMNRDALNISYLDEEKPERMDTALWNYHVQRVEDVTLRNPTSPLNAAIQMPDPKPQMVLPPLNSRPKAGLISWKVFCVFFVMVVSLATDLTFLIAGENKVSLTIELTEVSLLLFPLTKCLGRAKLGASALIWRLLDDDHLLYMFYLKIRLFRLSLHPYFFWCYSILQVTFSTTVYKEAKVLTIFCIPSQPS